MTFSSKKTNASRLAILLCSLVALGSTASCASDPSADPTSNDDATSGEPDLAGDVADESDDESEEGTDTDGAFSYEYEPNQSMGDEDVDEDEDVSELAFENDQLVVDDAEVTEEEVAALDEAQGVGKKSGHAAGWTRPLANYRISQRFRSGHNGIDLAKPYGSIVYAARAGKVTEIIRGRCKKGYRCVGTGRNWAVGKYYMSGDRIVVTHSNRTKTIYNHTGAAGLSYVGKVVRPDTPIGRLNRTGNRSGPHLHFSVRVGSKFVNPTKYIRF